MPRIHFTYRERVTASVEASCQVPFDIIRQGKEAIQKYVEENESDWERGDTTNEYEDRTNKPELEFPVGFNFQEE